MSDLVPIDPKKIPAHLQKKSAARQALDAGVSAGMGAPSFPRISIKGSRFRIVENGEETVLQENVLPAIVIGANPKLSKTWYEKAWTPDAEPSAPDCFSLDGVRPHAESSSPQCDLCAKCPKNAFGSATNAMGKPIKACSDQKRLAIIAASAADGPAYLLQITPAAIGTFNKYVRELNKHGLSISEVVTHVSFDTKASFPKLMFRFGDYIDEATDEIVLERIGSDEVLEITGEMAADGVVPQVASNKPQLVHETKDEVEDAEVEEVKTPPAKSAFGAKKEEPAAEEQVDSKPAPKKAPAKAPTKKAAPAPADTAADALDDELSSMLDDLDADDE